MGIIASRLRSIFHLLSAIFIYIVTLILSFLPKHVQTRLLFARDATIGALLMVIARLLPRLEVPNIDLTGKTAIVTGANSGIGLQIATDLVRRNCIVYLACRSQPRAEAAINTIAWRVPGSRSRVKYLDLDTSSLDSVRQCALLWSRQWNKSLDILVHNAGVPGPPATGSDMTDDGIEITYAINFLGSFLLTHFLEPYLTPSARVIFTTSYAQFSGSFSEDFASGPVRGICEGGFHCPAFRVLGWKTARDGDQERYSNTKAMQVAFVKLLQERFDRVSREKRDGGDGSNVRQVAHAFTPGFVLTPIFGKMNVQGWFRRGMWMIWDLTIKCAVDVDQGAATGSWLAMTNHAKVMGKGNGGRYWDRMENRMSRIDTMDRSVLDRLWSRWEKDAGVQWR